MELVFQTTDHQKASKICTLLESNGIPAFKTNENVNRLNKIGFAGIRIFVHINSQKHDAICLINEPLYMVKNKVDIVHFYKQAENVDLKEINNYLISFLLKSIGALLVITIIGFLITSKT